MKSFLLIGQLLICSFFIYAQKIDSIYFHLYTDSLKKGTYNYINIDGLRSNGQWLPLSAKEIYFTASGGRFDGNSLFIDTGYRPEKVWVKAVLKADTSIYKETSIYIKKMADNERLRTSDEIMRPGGKKQ